MADYPCFIPAGYSRRTIVVRRAIIRHGTFLGTYGSRLRFRSQRAALAWIRSTPGVWGLFVRHEPDNRWRRKGHLRNIGWFLGEVQI